jgi:hypothetical protein
LSRRIVEEATAESGDGYSVTVKGLTEDKALGEPCVANRGAVDLIVTGPDGTTLSFRLPGDQAELTLRPVAIGRRPSNPRRMWPDATCATQPAG